MKSYKLSNLIEKVVDNRGKTPKTTDKGYSLLEINSIVNTNRFPNYSMVSKYVDENTYQSSFRAGHPQINDVLVSTVGTIGKFALVDRNDICIAQNLVALRFNSLTIPKYLYYTLSSPINYQKIINLDIGGVQPNLKLPHLLDFEISIHDYEKQQHIVDILGSIDDKIEYSEKLLTVIEQKIHLLFRQFYEKLSVESTIGTEFACLLGGTPKTNIPDFWNGDINWINSGEVNKLRVTQASKKITRLGMEKSATKLLPKGTTVIAITGATLGQVSLLEIDTCANQSVIGVLCNRFGKDFIYPLICYHITDLIGKQTGGAQQHINMNDVKSLSIKIPTEQEYCIYSKKVLPLFEKQSNLCLEITKLNELKQLYLKKFFG